MSVHPISYQDTFLPGQTLDSNFDPAQPPFDTDSLPELFDQDKFKELAVTTNGQQKQLFQLTLTSQDKVTSLDVNGSLDLTCGAVTGDAKVKFAMDNINSGLSLSIVYRVSKSGTTQRVDLFDLGKLKLSDTVLTQIKDNKLTFDQFVASYGKYIIIGFESGGEILYDSTYSTKDSEDKAAVSGGLALAYNNVPGFSVSGSVNGDYKQSDIAKSLDVTTRYLINPTSDSQQQEDLLKYLNQLTNISQNADIDPKTLVDLKTNIDLAANGILNPKSGTPSLDWSKAIIYGIDSIPCVSDAFAQQAITNESISGFLQYLNQLYVEINSKSQDMSAMTDKWENPPPSFQTYAVKFTQIIQLIQTLSDYTSLSNYGKKYNEYIQSGDNDDDTKQENKEDDNDIDEKQIDLPTNEFYKINIAVLNSEYNADIFAPFNDYISKGELTASFSVACDDYYTVNLSQDSGASYEKIIDEYSDLKSVKTIDSIAISSKTVLQFVCTNRGGPAGFIALIELSNGEQYMTPDGNFKCTTSTTKPSQENPTMYRFDKDAWTSLDKVFPDNASFIWPNNDQKKNEKDTQTFEFRFSDIIS